MQKKMTTQPQERWEMEMGHTQYLCRPLVSFDILQRFAEVDEKHTNYLRTWSFRFSMSLICPSFSTTTPSPCFTTFSFAKSKTNIAKTSVCNAEPQKKTAPTIGITHGHLWLMVAIFCIGPRYAAEKWSQRTKQLTAAFDTNLSKSD